MVSKFAWTALTQNISHFISFASIMVLARLLAPEETGVFAIVSGVAFLAIELRSFGAGRYLVRQKTVDRDDIRRALGLAIIVGWGVGAIILAIAPFVATFYKEPDIRQLLQIISLTAFLSPFTSIPLAMMHRALAVKRIMVVQVCSALLRAGCTIALAYAGWSYYSLAIGTVAGAFAEFCLVNILAKRDARALPLFSGLKQLVLFGSYSTTTGVLERTGYMLPDMIIGRLGTMYDVGIFSRGLGLLVFFDRILSMSVRSIVLPHFSQIVRQEGDIKDAYVRATVMQTAFSWPAFLAIGLVATPVIDALFGDQWVSAGPLTTILIVWFSLKATHCYLADVLIATGHEKIMTYREIAVFTARAIAIAIGATQSLLAVTYCLAVVGVFELLLGFAVARAYLGITVPSFLARLVPSVLVSVCAILGCYALAFEFFSTLQLGQLLILAACTGVVWLTAIFLVRHPLAAVITGIMPSSSTRAG